VCVSLYALYKYRIQFNTPVWHTGVSMTLTLETPTTSVLPVLKKTLLTSETRLEQVRAVMCLNMLAQGHTSVPGQLAGNTAVRKLLPEKIFLPEFFRANNISGAIANQVERPARRKHCRERRFYGFGFSAVRNAFRAFCFMVFAF